MNEIPEGTRAHRAEAAQQAPARVAVVIVSDSRTAQTDTSGPAAVELLERAGHAIVNYALLPNDETRVRAHVDTHISDSEVDVVVLSGGTGLSARDRTIEAVRPLFDKELPGFGELFRLISYQDDIGTAAILTRATAGIAQRTVVVSLPGSTAAVRLALSRILIPELPHLLREVRR
jgi:molybdopterin adenylyltransferase